MEPLTLSQAPINMQLDFHRSAQATLVADFGRTLEICRIGLINRSYLSLAGNVDTLFGSTMAREFLAKQLCLSTGKVVDVSISEDGLQTIVQIVSENVPLNPTFLPNANPSLATFTSQRLLQQPVGAQLPSPTLNNPEGSTNAARSASTVRKNPPRPMNCFLLYRDTRRIQLKEQHPTLTVQQISKLCSIDWKNLSPDQKGIWKARADAAKAQHERKYPDYKYNPRRPGEKKKRQSRKATRDVRAAAALPNPAISNYGINTASEAFIRNITGGSATDMAQSISSYPGTSSQATEAAYEATRHIAFTDETDSLDNVHFELYGDERLAFRNGADGSATLPYMPERF